MSECELHTFEILVEFWGVVVASGVTQNKVGKNGVLLLEACA